jgi:hypothetical protein
MEQDLLAKQGAPAELRFRLAIRADVADIVSLLADDVLGAPREAFVSPLPQRYYAAFAAIDDDLNNELIVAELSAPNGVTH